MASLHKCNDLHWNGSLDEEGCHSQMDDVISEAFPDGFDVPELRVRHHVDLRCTLYFHKYLCCRLLHAAAAVMSDRCMSRHACGCNFGAGAVGNWDPDDVDSANVHGPSGCKHP